METRTYQNVLRLVAVLIAIMLWVISVYFSQDGFAINVPNMAWVGWLLAISITAIEMIWNQEGFKHNATIVVVGLAAYTYGIWTNATGIMEAQGIRGMNFLDAPMQLIFPVVLGIFLEIVPEPLLMWAIVGLNREDLLSHLIGISKSDVPVRTSPVRNVAPIHRPEPTFRPVITPTGGQVKGPAKPEFPTFMRK
jgi:hypothetical protein